MRLGAEDLGLNILFKPVHDGKYNDQGHHADSDTYNRETGCEADEALALL
jgi:hypothetical protein